MKADFMAYYTNNSAQVFPTPAHYSSPGVYYSASVGVHPVPRQLPSHPPGKYAASFNSCCSIGFGVLLVMCGAVSFAGAAIGLRFFAALAEIGAGLWCGSMFVATGAVAIAAGVHKTDSLISGGTATSCFAILLGTGQLSISVNGLLDDINSYNCNHYDSGCSNYPNYYSCRCIYENWETYAIVANSLLIGASSIELIFALGLLIVNCIALCNPKQNQVVTGGLYEGPHFIPTAPYQGVSGQQAMTSVPMQFGQNTHLCFAHNCIRADACQPPICTCQQPQQLLVAPNHIQSGVLQLSTPVLHQ